MLRVAVMLFLLAGAVCPVAAQVRYKDAEGVTHWVDSLEQVPSEFRPAAVGKATPPAPLKPSQPTDWEREFREAAKRREQEARGAQRDKVRAAAVDDCAKRLVTDVPVRVPLHNSEQRNKWLPDWCHGISLEEMRQANLRRRW